LTAFLEWLRTVDPASAIVAIFVTLPIIVVLHELGHAGAALLMGLRPAALALGPALITRHGVSLGPWQGFWVASLPKLGEANLADRQLVVVAGGPAASFLTATLALSVAFVLAHQASNAAFFFGFLGVSSLLHLATVLVPAAPDGVPSDGARLIQLWTGGNAREGLEAMLQLQVLESAGIPPAQWPREAIEQCRALPPGHPDHTASHVSLVVPWLLAAGRWDEAATELKQLERAERTLLPALRPTLHALLALVSAHHGEVTTARHHLRDAKPSSRVSHFLLRSIQTRLPEGLPDAPSLAPAVSSPRTGTDQLWLALE